MLSLKSFLLIEVSICLMFLVKPHLLTERYGERYVYVKVVHFRAPLKRALKNTIFWIHFEFSKNVMLTMKFRNKKTFEHTIEHRNLPEKKVRGKVVGPPFNSFRVKCERIDPFNGGAWYGDWVNRTNWYYSKQEFESSFPRIDNCWVRFKLHVVCAPHFYVPPKCNRYCKPNREIRRCHSTSGWATACNTGFSGRLCRDNLCDTYIGHTLCKNGATCNNIQDDFTCTCSPGYRGRICNEDINECPNSPCQHGGTCTNTYGTFVCSCTSEYVGKTCEKDANPCIRPNLCNNNGTCQNTRPGNFECLCDPGYNGTTCENEIDECARPDTCENGGTCENVPGSFECKCPPYFSGPRCAVNDDACATILPPCENGGTCANSNGSFVCYCAENYVGEHCQLLLTAGQMKIRATGATIYFILGIVALSVVATVGMAFFALKQKQKKEGS